MSLAEYISKNYADSSNDGKKKKKKQKKSKKNKESNNNIINNYNDDISLSESEEGPVIIEKKVSQNKNGGWINVLTNEKDDSILIKNNNNENNTNSNKKLMNDGSFAGLQTKESLKESLNNKRDKFNRDLQETLKTDLNSKTIYRDIKTGRKLSDSEIKTSNDEKEQFHIRREEEIKKLNQSEADRINKNNLNKRLEQISNEKLNIYEESNEEYNKNVKEKLKEDDPMLIYNPKAAKSLNKSKFTSITGRKLYTGSFPENRFGILPGYRWDGIDRSNGYERKRFDKLNQINERKVLNYTMSEDL